MAETLTERDEWRCVLTDDGGQFALEIRHWQELFVHKWDTSLKVTQDDKYMYPGITNVVFTAYIESTLALPNIFPPGAFPEYRLDCTQLSNGTWHCSPVIEQQCDSFVELGVVCKNYEDVYNENLRNCTEFPVTTTQSPTTQQGKLINAKDIMYSTTSQVLYYTYKIPLWHAVTTPVACTGNSTTVIAGSIGVLVALLLAISVGWIVSCVILLRRGQNVHKQQ